MFKGRLDDGELYVLDFIEEPPNGRRYIVCRAVSDSTTLHACHSSPPHTGAELTHWRANGLLSKNTTFADGTQFHLGAHGEWLAAEEFIAWRQIADEN